MAYEAKNAFSEPFKAERVQKQKLQKEKKPFSKAILQWG